MLAKDQELVPSNRRVTPLGTLRMMTQNLILFKPCQPPEAKAHSISPHLIKQAVSPVIELNEASVKALGRMRLSRRGILCWLHGRRSIDSPRCG